MKQSNLDSEWIEPGKGSVVRCFAVNPGADPDDIESWERCAAPATSYFTSGGQLYPVCDDHQRGGAHISDGGDY